MDLSPGSWLLLPRVTLNLESTKTEAVARNVVGNLSTEEVGTACLLIPSTAALPSGQQEALSSTCRSLHIISHHNRTALNKVLFVGCSINSTIAI
jgi:hypothetical protein